MQTSHPRWSVRALTLLVLTIMIVGLQSVSAQEAYQTRNLSAIVYADGNILVTHEADVDTTSPRVDIPLLGTSFQNILVVDQRGIPLDYSIAGNVLRIDTLGAYRLRISYQASGLTSLNGDVRILAISAPATTIVTLSRGLDIISLSPIPLQTEQVDGAYRLTFPQGRVEVGFKINLAAPIVQPLPQPQPVPQPRPGPQLAPAPAPAPQQPAPIPAPAAAPQPQQQPAPVPGAQPAPGQVKPEEQSQLISPQNLLVIGVAVVLAIVGVFLTRRRKSKMAATLGGIAVSGCSYYHCPTIGSVVNLT